MGAVVGYAEDPDQLAAGTMVGEYRIEQVIGQGGMGTVYAAHHPVIGKRAAVKVISRDLSANASAVERFVLEARAVNQIGDPNIVDVFAFGSLPDGRSYLVMERLVGESLASRSGRERIPLPEVLAIVDDIARTLTATHEAGIVHRDLKPDNVFLCAGRDGRSQVKLLDFGIAKLTDGGRDPRQERTRTGMIIGTPSYISPEQAAGAPVDVQADVYALGVITYELLLGRAPFKADTAVQLMAMHISAVPEPPRAIWPGIPLALDRLVLAMLEKSPARRPPLAEVRRVLAEIASSSHTPPPWTPVPASPTTGGWQEPRRSRLWLALVIGLLCVGGGVAAAMLALDRRDGETVAEDPRPAPTAPVTPKPAPVVAPPPEPTPDLAEPVPGSIRVEVSVKRARIAIDGRPVSPGVIELAPGSHQVVVSAPGRVTVREQVHVEAGEQVTLRPRLEPIRKRPGTPAGSDDDIDAVGDPFR
jgi:serine/threonine protein kinase